MQQTSDLGEKRKPEIQTVPVGDIQVAYRVYGEGDPLLLIMGFGGTMDTWNPDVLAALAGKYRLILFDNRGMGGTTPGTKPFSIEQFAEDTLGLLQALKIERAYVLSWSMGTNVALELALRHPDRVNKLILYAANPGGSESVPPSPEVIKRLADTSGSEQQRGQRLLELLLPVDWIQANVSYVQRIFSGASETSSPESIGREAQAIADWKGCYDRLPSIKSRTLLITGTGDLIAPPGNSLKMVQQIPGAWLVQFNGGGHGIMYQFPDSFSRVVLDFLAAP
jgi:pimeloyl-ACP methyl ester carboxylesterase